MNINDQRIAHIKNSLVELRSTTVHAQQLIDDISLTLTHLNSPVTPHHPGGGPPPGPSRPPTPPGPRGPVVPPSQQGGSTSLKALRGGPRPAPPGPGPAGHAPAQGPAGPAGPRPVGRPLPGHAAPRQDLPPNPYRPPQVGPPPQGPRPGPRPRPQQGPPQGPPLQGPRPGPPPQGPRPGPQQGPPQQGPHPVPPVNPKQHPQQGRQEGPSQQGPRPVPPVTPDQQPQQSPPPQGVQLAPQPAPPHSRPPAFVPRQPFKPVTPPLTTEQKVIRAAAVLGSIITFIGACFGVALAIQSGLLGPIGRTVGAFLLALVLLGIGIRIDLRRGAQPGVTALYVTSYLIIVADLLYMTGSQQWLSFTGLCFAGVTVWTAFLALAMWRRNLWLVLNMCFAYFFYGVPIFDGDLINVLAFVPPLLALALTWFIPSDRTPKLALSTRFATGILMFRDLVMLSFLSSLDYDVTFASLVVYVGVFLFIIGERYFPIRLTGQTERISMAVLAPVILIVTSYFVIGQVSLWIPVAVTFAATVTVAVLWFDVKDQEQMRLGNIFLASWLGFFAFTFLPVVLRNSGPYSRHGSTQATGVVLFLLAFAAVLVLLRLRPLLPRVPLLSAWLTGLLFITAYLLPGTLSPKFARATTVENLIVGLALLAFLVFAAIHIWKWREIETVERRVFAGAALWFSTIAVVTASTALGELISPSCLRSIFQGTSDEPDNVCPSPQGYEVGFFVGHMIISISLMALASWLLIKRPKPGSDSKAARVTGLVFAGVATGKLVLFDMASLSGVPRVIAFVVCGLLLIAVAVLGAQRNSNSNGGHAPGPSGSFPPFMDGAPIPPVGPAGEPQPVGAPAPVDSHGQHTPIQVSTEPGPEVQSEQQPAPEPVQQQPDQTPEQKPPQQPAPEPEQQEPQESTATNNPADKQGDQPS